MPIRHDPEPTRDRDIAARRRLSADTALLGTAFVWGVTFVTVKQAVSEIPTATFLALRFALAFAVLAPVFRREMASARRRLAGPGIVLGVLMWGGYYLQTLGVALTQASRAGFITGLTLVLVPVFSALIVRERPPARALAGVGLGLAGLVCMFLLPAAGSAATSGGLAAGDLLILACTVSFALQVTLTGLYSPTRAQSHREAGALAAIQMAIAALLSLLVVLARYWRGDGTLGPVFGAGATWASPFSWSTAGGIVICGVLASAGALLAQTIAQRFTPPTHTALILATEPVFAVLAGWLLLGERLGVWGGLGCLLILAGMLAAEMPLRKKAPSRGLVGGVRP